MALTPICIEQSPHVWKSGTA